MTVFRGIEFFVLAALFANHIPEADGGWIRNTWDKHCTTITAISCRAVAVGGGAAIGGVAGAVAGSVLSEVCTPVSKWVCNRRRRALPDKSESDRFTLYALPQTFEDYTTGQSMAFTEFIAGIKKVLSDKVLHHYSVLAKAFDDADKDDNGELTPGEFADGSWIADDSDMNAMKREIVARGFVF